MAKFGILEGNNLIYYRNVNSLEELGLLALKKRMKEEGFSFDTKGTIAYMNGWVETLNEIGADEEEEEITDPIGIIDVVSGNVIHSNNFFFIDKEQIMGESLDKMEKVVISFLNKKLK